MNAQKNPWVAAALGFFFGPFGILYVSLKQALIGFGVCVAVLLVTFGFATPAVPIGYAVWGYLAAKKYNEMLGREQQVAAERLAAHLVAQGMPGPASSPPSSVPLLGQLPAPQPASAWCSSCGQALRAGARFCGACGATQVAESGGSP